MPHYVPTARLLEHVPILRDGELTGCAGCEWVPYHYRPTTFWLQYLQHLPDCKLDGELILSDSDMREMHDLNAAFLGPVKRFDE